MKYILILLAFPILSASDCGKKKKITEEQKTPEVSMPACLQKMIDDAGKQSPPEVPLQVDEYLYNGKTVYLVTAPCCDHYNTLYDTECKEICAPTGGFTGKGDGKCEDFSKTATHVKMVWKKDK